MIDQHGKLANFQYRFRKGKSTLGAVEEIVTIGRRLSREPTEQDGLAH